MPTPTASSVARRLGRSVVVVVLLAVAISGCVRLLEPRTSNLSYYLLDSSLSADSLPSDTSGLSVGLRDPHLAEYLDASRMVLRHGPNRVQFSEFHRWGEELGPAINRVVAVNLEAQPIVGSAEVVPWRDGATFDYVIQLHVLRFEGQGPEVPESEKNKSASVPTGQSHMLVQWTVLGPNGNRVLGKGRTRHRGDDWPVTDFSALASRLDSSLSVLAADIAERLQALQE